VWHYRKTKQTIVNGKLRNAKRPREEWIAVPVPTIINADTFAAAQARMQQNKAKAKRNRKRSYLFGHRIRCKLCGYTIVGGAKSSGKEYVYYRCYHNHARFGESRCTMPPIAEAEMLPLVWAWLTDLVNNPDKVLVALNARAEIDAERAVPKQQRFDMIAKKLADLDRQLKRVVETFTANPDLPMEWLGEQKARLTGQRGDLERERADLAAQLEQQHYTPERVRSIAHFCTALRGRMNDATPEQMLQTFEVLNLQLEATIEDDQKVVYATCSLGEKRVEIASSFASSLRFPKIFWTPSAQQEHHTSS
jgi:site-specific DNA recombinase